MDSLIETFHLDIKLLAAQMINFAIVFSVLYFFALKPLIKIMRDRTVRIEKSLEDAAKIDDKLKAAKAEHQGLIIQAKKEANELLEKAHAQAEARREEIIKKAKEEVGAVISAEKAKMQQEKAAVLKEIRADVAGLVASAVENVLEKKMDAKIDNELIKKAISGKQ